MFCLQKQRPILFIGFPFSLPQPFPSCLGFTDFGLQLRPFFLQE
jgi:hypothetical protein